MVSTDRFRWVWLLLAATLMAAFVVQVGRFYHPVRSTRWRRGLVLLLLGNLSVASGLLYILPVARASDELGAARFGSAAYVAQARSGFYLVEQSRNHRWCWSGGDAELRLQSWRATGPVGLRFKLHAYRPPCTVTIAQDKRVLWIGVVDRAGAPITIDRVEFAADGTARLHLFSDQPKVVDPGSVDGRTVVFSAWDLEFVQ